MKHSIRVANLTHKMDGGKGGCTGDGFAYFRRLSRLTRPIYWQLGCLDHSGKKLSGDK